jgi:hypothetical protein
MIRGDFVSEKGFSGTVFHFFTAFNHNSPQLYYITRKRSFSTVILHKVCEKLLLKTNKDIGNRTEPAENGSGNAGFTGSGRALRWCNALQLPERCVIIGL